MSVLGNIATGPWWGLRCCCESVLDCTCPLHYWAEGDIYSRCDPNAFLVIEPFIIEGPSYCPGIDEVDFWGGTYLVPQSYSFWRDPYCLWHWSSDIWAATHHIQVGVYKTGYVAARLYASAPYRSHDIIFGRQVFSGPPPWNFYELGEITLPFVSFSALSRMWGSTCKFPSSADVTLYFTDAMGRNPWLGL